MFDFAIKAYLTISWDMFDCPVSSTSDLVPIRCVSSLKLLVDKADALVGHVSQVRGWHPGAVETRLRSYL